MNGSAGLGRKGRCVEEWCCRRAHAFDDRGFHHSMLLWLSILYFKFKCESLSEQPNLMVQVYIAHHWRVLRLPTGKPLGQRNVGPRLRQIASSSSPPPPKLSIVFCSVSFGLDSFTRGFLHGSPFGQRGMAVTEGVLRRTNEPFGVC